MNHNDLARYRQMTPGQLAHTISEHGGRNNALFEACAERILHLCTENMRLRGTLCTLSDFGHLLVGVKAPLQGLVRLGPVHLDTAVKEIEKALSVAAMTDTAPKPDPLL